MDPNLPETKEQDKKESIEESKGETLEQEAPTKEDEAQAAAKEDLRQKKQEEDEMLFTKRRLTTLTDENKKLSNELEALKERMLRLNAEYDNFRRRTAREKSDISDNCTADVIRDILPVIDNLERALLEETKNASALKDGVDLTLSQFQTVMKKLGVEVIDTESGFDPNLHEAVMHEVDEQRGEREVSEVFLKGYKKGDKVIRHSVVKVAN
ncbi:Heat shock protein GrpE [Clostridiaceae bacterium JG1575]|nr:Heat shock protein GrpE [Clostridiaceae bacterium JG1575]